MEPQTVTGPVSVLCCEPPSLPDPLFILLVGEGNLSFAYALVRRLSRSTAFRRATQSAASPGSVVAVVATTYDSESDVAAKYPESAAFRAYFAVKQRVPVRYIGSVNATALSSSLSVAHLDIAAQPFHLVVFNNPHIGFEDLYRQRSLLSHFFASAAELRQRGPAMRSPQEVVVAVCDDQAQRWDLLGCAARSGYLCVAAQPLLTAAFPEYTNRRHQSDAAFPFRRMVQYWFVQPTTPELRATVRDLHAELALWDGAHRECVAHGQPCGFSCVSWLQTAATLLPDTCTVPALSRAATKSAEAPLIGGRDGHDVTLNFTAGDSAVPMPLLHPAMVARVLSALLHPGVVTATAAAEADVFTPYLPMESWVPLYRAQRSAEEHRGETTVETEDARESAVPPHLDTAKLGRPLTTKEAKKLERYRTGYGAAMRTKTLQRRAQETAASTDYGSTWVCTACTPPRCFDAELDFQQHQSSKHSGAVQLTPTLYARVHTQIEKSAEPPSADALDSALAAMVLDEKAEGYYCAVCGLLYKTSEAFEEHLRYLAPLPGDNEIELMCDACNPPRRFTDRRGLEQHRSSKHHCT